MGTLEEFTRTLLLITALGVMLLLLGFMIARFGMRPVNTMSEQGISWLAIMVSGLIPPPYRMNCKRWRKPLMAYLSDKKWPGGNWKALTPMSPMSFARR
jgi:hypothetical protein